MGFITGLQLLFIALKLCHQIDWSWWIVLLPIIIGSSFWVIGIAIALVLLILAWWE